MRHAPSTQMIFLVEDWQPVEPSLRSRLVDLGHQVDVLPNVFDLVRKRVLRDRPDLVLVNASSLVMGESDRWRQVLSGATSAVVVVPPAANAVFFESARALGFCGMLDLPVETGKLELALHIAVRNGRAAARLRSEIERLRTIQGRVRDRRPAGAAAAEGAPAEPESATRWSGAAPAGSSARPAIPEAAPA